MELLQATVSVRELAGLLRVPSWQVQQRIEAGGIQAWSLPGGPQRVGWRSARDAIARAFDGEQLAQALRNLHEVRAGRLLAQVGPEPPVLTVEARRRHTGVNYDRDALLGLLSDAADALGVQRLTRPLYNNWAAAHDQPWTAQRICAALGEEWSALLDELDLQTRPQRSDFSLSNEQVLALLQEAAALTSGNLSRGRFESWATGRGIEITAALVIGRFGSWNVAKRIAGLDVRRRRSQTMSDEALLDLLREHVTRTPAVTAADFNARCRMNGVDVRAADYASRFGSWNAAKVRVGGTPRRPGFQGPISAVGGPE